MIPKQSSTASRTLISHVADWLMTQALGENDLEKIVMGCCERLRAAGLPLVRGHFAFTILHPLNSAIGVTWTRGDGTTVQGYPHVPGGTSDMFKKSPHFYMIERNLDYMRARICDKTGQYDFPILEDLKKEGVTEYLAFVVGFIPDRRSGMLGSWATDAADGFSDDAIDALLRIQDRLAVACKMAMKTRLMGNVAFTYLGPNAGARVLDGQIKRGDGQAIEAAIWYSDLRGSTAMADNLPAQDYIDNLNTYFDATGGAVRDEGGEILSFIGDGLLAIFPKSDDEAELVGAGRRALAASFDAHTRIKEANEARGPLAKDPLKFGIALHMGEVMYGNVGVPERLTFSVFGAAVNEVVRLEQLTKELSEPILISDQFVGSIGDGCRLVGEHGLRGVGRRMVVHAPLGSRAAAA